MMRRKGQKNEWGVEEKEDMDVVRGRISEMPEMKEVASKER